MEVEEWQITIRSEIVICHLVSATWVARNGWQITITFMARGGTIFSVSLLILIPAIKVYASTLTGIKYLDFTPSYLTRWPDSGQFTDISKTGGIVSQAGSERLLLYG